MTIEKESSFVPPVEEILAFGRERNICLSVKWQQSLNQHSLVHITLGKKHLGDLL